MGQHDPTLRTDSVETRRRCLAFTFDDGPDPADTPRILDILKQHRSRATFFMLGEHVVAYPDIVLRVRDEGHEIGNHSFAHPDLTEISAAQCEAELRMTADAICDVTGDRPRIYRPPYFRVNAEVATVARLLGYNVTVGATKPFAEDWLKPSVEHIVSVGRTHFVSGHIVLFHDGFGDRAQTVEAVSILVPEAVAAGFELVTVSELLAQGANKDYIQD